ncbi:probable nucleic acid dioxygenase ALKBH1 at C-terminar half [Coccomyxa sp. Obi]|nr:probable nucleic acid dioxygenase ALKBH1 at C-terminar half [Coccomyxa sp. Obi]
MGQYLQPSEDTEGRNAFRIAEKKYQLHWNQELRYRRGKLRGRKISPVQTDFSEVLDFLDQSTWQSSAVLVAYSEHLHKEVFGLADHPGFFVIPGAIGPDVHRQLIVSALEDYPEPPCNTNHTRAHGHLGGLWKAAQLGQCLHSPLDTAAASAAPVRDSGTHAACTFSAIPPASQVTARCTASHHRADGAKEATSKISAHACQNSHQETATGVHAVREAACSLQQARGGSQQQDRSDKVKAGAWGKLGEQLQWEPGGAGPPAAQLLRKLRWVTLGPQFDWSTRVYNAHAPHRPLPPELRALAVTLASAVADLDLQPPADTHTGCNDIDSQSLAQSKESGKVSQSYTDAAWNCLDSQEWGDWEPDVALVNYYREGDTLGGHRDDAEPNMRAPIVALSLGCDAIFLLGRETRDEDPVAMRIRGGDAVVMAGHARQCYHGVPRVFMGTSSACWPAEEGSTEAERLRPFAQHMHDCRINISIRCAR